MDAMQLDLFGNPAPPPPPAPILVREHVRRRVAPAPKTAIALRDEAIAKIQADRKEWLAKARGVALVVAADAGSVSADDINIPLPTGASPNIRGAIFWSRWFAPAGYIKSIRPQGHANRIARYHLTQEGRAALAKLLEE